MKKYIIGLAALFILALLPLAALADGNGEQYTGEAKGYGGALEVQVQFSDGKINDVSVSSHNETPEYGGRAVSELPERIETENSLGVDAVSGATITSRAILRATADALSKANVDPKSFGYVPMEEIQAKDVITIYGLPGQPVAQVTGEQLMGMESVTVDAVSVNSSGKETSLTAKGVKLETVLNLLGASQKDPAAITFTASDGYAIEVPGEILKNRDVIIAWEVNGEPQSPRTLVPGERAMYWCKFLADIELKYESVQLPVTRVHTLEGLLSGTADQAQDYEYHGSMDRAVQVSVLLDKLGMVQAPDVVRLTSIDGWGKNDKYETVAAQFIKFTGESAPMFVGPDLPEGMRLKDVLTMKVGEELVLSCEMAMKKQSADGNVSKIPLADLLKLCEMKNATVYRIEVAEGEAIDADEGMIQEMWVDVDAGSAKLHRGDEQWQLLNIEAL